MEPLELTHLATMQEEGLSEQTLPIEFKPKLMSLQMMIGRYNNTPTQNLKDSIEKASAKISHDILDFVEKDLPDEDVNADGTPIDKPISNEPPVHQTEQSPVAPVIPPISETPPPPPNQDPPKAKKSSGVFDMFGW